MIQKDTIKLLRECDAGIKMGVCSIEDVLDHVTSPELRTKLDNCKRAHDTLKTECSQLLNEFGDNGKEPAPVAKGMSWIKTNAKMAVDESDATIADLMTDGCNMGVKSLNRYLNQYKAADERSKDITKRLIQLEEGLTNDMRSFL